MSGVPALRFRLGRVPVAINVTFFVVTLLVGLQFRESAFIGTWVAVVLVSVLVHEWGHVLALRHYGRPSKVMLTAMGGMTISADERSLAPRASILVSLAGPAAGLVFGLLMAVSLPDTSRVLHVLAYQLWFVNIWWSLFNLLPILPLDGGHVALEAFDVAARVPGGAVAAMGSASFFVIAAGLALFGVDRLGWILLVVVLMVATTATHVPFTFLQRRSVHARDAHEQMLAGDLRGGSTRLLSIMSETPAATITAEAYTTLAWALLHEGRFDELCRLDMNRIHPNHRNLIGAAMAWYRGDMATCSALVTHALAVGTVDPPPNYFRVTFGRLGELDQLRSWIEELPPELAATARERMYASLSEPSATG